MASKYWLKLYHEVLDDPKMARLSDRLYRRTIETFLLAGDYEADGLLPSLDDMAWRLRLDADQLETDLHELATRGILILADGNWEVAAWAQRQDPMDAAERQRRKRANDRHREYAESQESDGPVTAQSRKGDTDQKRSDQKRSDADFQSARLQQILDAWKEYFPNKPQPRATTKSIQAKLRTRLESPIFVNNWRKAMKAASKSPSLNSDSWFTLAWFLRNDDNYQKCLDGFMAWKDNDVAKAAPPPRINYTGQGAK